MKQLIRTLELSIKKHGDKPLTTQYLLNILKYSETCKLQASSKEERFLDSLADECLTPNQ